MLSHFEGTKADPITGREISNHCWNGHHEGSDYHDDLVCLSNGCKCFCHDTLPFDVAEPVEELNGAD